MENKHVAFVKKDSIEKLSKGKILKTFDLIVTKDSDVIYYLNDDLNLIPIRPEVMIYESEADAIESINQDSMKPSIQIGQNIIVKNQISKKYSMYIINKDNEDNFIVEPVYDPNLLKLSNLINDIHFQTDKDVDNTITTKIQPYDADAIQNISADNDSL